MKKLMLFAAFAIASGICTAQVSFGIQAGANFGMGKFKYNDAYFYSAAHSQKNKVKVGFLGGFIAQIPITSQLAFRPELNFFQEGTKYSNTDVYLATIIDEKDNLNLNYVQIPLNVIYKMPVGMGSIFFGLGPVAEIGLSGKDKYTSVSDPTYNKNYKVKFDGKSIDDLNNGNGDGDDHLKRFDVGLDVIAGYQLSMGVFMKVGYGHGLIDINPNKDAKNDYNRSSYKNSGINVSVGYMIGGGAKKKS